MLQWCSIDLSRFTEYLIMIALQKLIELVEVIDNIDWLERIEKERVAFEWKAVSMCVKQPKIFNDFYHEIPSKWAICDQTNDGTSS